MNSPSYSLTLCFTHSLRGLLAWHSMHVEAIYMRTYAAIRLASVPPEEFSRRFVVGDTAEPRTYINQRENKKGVKHFRVEVCTRYNTYVRVLNFHFARAQGWVLAPRLICILGMKTGRPLTSALEWNCVFFRMKWRKMHSLQGYLINFVCGM